MRGREKKKRKEKGFDSRYADGRKSLVRELKLVHETRATRGYQKLRVSSRSKR